MTRRRQGTGKGRGASGRRRNRPGAARRQLTLAACAIGVGTSLAVSVHRTAAGHELAESINDLRAEEELLRIRLSEELVRVDSLASRGRILVAAARLGLRPARDDEIVHLPDVGP